MKTIGLMGGMSWESSALYYRLINEMTRDSLGGLHSARCITDEDFYRIIYSELVRGIVSEGSSRRYIEIIESLVRQPRARFPHHLVACPGRGPACALRSSLGEGARRGQLLRPGEKVRTARELTFQGRPSLCTLAGLG